MDLIPDTVRLFRRLCSILMLLSTFLVCCTILCLSSFILNFIFNCWLLESFRISLVGVDIFMLISFTLHSNFQIIFVDNRLLKVYAETYFSFIKLIQILFNNYIILIFYSNTVTSVKVNRSVPKITCLKSLQTLSQKNCQVP